MKLLPHHKQFVVIIAPSTETEDALSECEDFQAALDYYNNERGHLDDIVFGTDIHSFDTQAELDAFIEGYLAGIGWHGDGAYISYNKNI